MNRFPLDFWISRSGEYTTPPAAEIQKSWGNYNYIKIMIKNIFFNE